MYKAVFLATFCFLLCSVVMARAQGVLMVGDYDYSINGKPAVPFIYGESAEQYYELTIAKAALIDGNILQTPDKDFSIRATYGDQLYTCKQDSNVCAKISIKRGVNSVELIISSRLTNVATGKILEDDVSLRLDGENYQAMKLD